MKNRNINVNPITETIEVSKAFLKKAKVFKSAEWKELKEVRNAEPTFTVKEISIKKNTSKKPYGNLTFKAMVAHIELVETDEEDRANALKELEEIKNYSAARGSSYPIVNKWFLNKYKESYNNVLERNIKSTRPLEMTCPTSPFLSLRQRQEKRTAKSPMTR